MSKPEDLEEATIVLWRAAEIRDEQDWLKDPEALDTEESVIAALEEFGTTPFETVYEKDKYTKFLRIMRKLRKD